MAPWPANFKLSNITKYKGDTDPNEYLRVYEPAVEAAGGDDMVYYNSTHDNLLVGAYEGHFSSRVHRNL